MRLEQYPVIGPLARMAREELAVSAADIQEWLGRATETALRSVASIGSGLVIGALGTMVAFFFMLFLLFFFLRDGTGMFDRLQRLIPCRKTIASSSSITWRASRAACSTASA